MSYEFSGVIPHYIFYGTHLDSWNETMNVYLEKENFQHAGKTQWNLEWDIDWWISSWGKLCWQNEILQCLKHILSLIKASSPDMLDRHNISYEFLKCDSIKSWTSFHSNIFEVLPQRILSRQIQMGTIFWLVSYTNKWRKSDMIDLYRKKEQSNALEFL